MRLLLDNLAHRRGQSFNHNFHSEVQTHRQPLWHCCAFFLLLVRWSTLAYELIYDVVCGLRQRSQHVYGLCLTHLVSFPPEYWFNHKSLANQLWTYMHILSPIYVWSISTTESRYSFYRMSWASQPSEFKTETNFCRRWDSNQQRL